MQRPVNVPSYLVYEEVNGKPVYYKGYRDVLAGTKTVAEIMGASELQSLVVSVLLKYLVRNVDDRYIIASNEPGFHLKNRSNFSSDVIIYELSQFADGPVTKKYSERPPRVIFEIDIQGDFDTPEEAINYYHKKTQQLLDFGVRQLFWFFTDTRKVVIAEPDKPWLTVDWSEELTVLGQYKFSFKELIEASGLPFVLGGE